MTKDNAKGVQQGHSSCSGETRLDAGERHKGARRGVRRHAQCPQGVFFSSSPPLFRNGVSFKQWGEMGGVMSK